MNDIYNFLNHFHFHEVTFYIQLIHVLALIACMFYSVKAFFYFDRKKFWLFLSLGFLFIAIRRTIGFLTHHDLNVLNPANFNIYNETLFPFLSALFFLIALFHISHSYKKYISEVSKLSGENYDMRKALEKLMHSTNGLDHEVKKAMKRSRTGKTVEQGLEYGTENSR